MAFIVIGSNVVVNAASEPRNSRNTLKMRTKMMKATQIQIGHQYEVQAGRNKTKINVVSFDEEKQSWACKTPNGKIIKIKDTARFLKEVSDQRKPTGTQLVTPSNGSLKVQRKRAAATECQSATAFGPKHIGPKPLGDMSALAAAHRVLVEEARPMRVREITTTVLERGYCKLNGKTPHCTINGGMQKEIKTKGESSRFQWVGKGLFAAR